MTNCWFREVCRTAEHVVSGLSNALFLHSTTLAFNVAFASSIVDLSPLGKLASTYYLSVDPRGNWLRTLLSAILPVSLSVWSEGCSPHCACEVMECEEREAAAGIL